MGVFDQKSTLQDILQHRGMFEPATDLPVINKAALVGYICHITTELAAKDLTIEALKSTFKETVIELSSTHGTAIDAINNNNWLLCSTYEHLNWSYVTLHTVLLNLYTK